MKDFYSFIKRHKKKIWILVPALFLVSYGLSFAVLVTSDAYTTAKEYVYGSEELNNEFGKIQQVNIDFGIKPGGGISFFGDHAEANYNLNVFAKPNKHKIYIELEKIGRAWEVKKYKILY